ncbi:hypothetical protein PQQ73_35890 [Paraburkholderia strydomiana]|uniref:MmgE/PrpD C-terminal domain-containing protein n=1 Tax=Paraburkholderia strydomiana TaxID=1245417 RepID=A0ABW9ESF7_9BURK
MLPQSRLRRQAAPHASDVARQIGNINRIKAVEIRTSHEGWFSAGKDRQKWAPETSETADHSLLYIVALAMFDGDITLSSYTPQKLRDSAIRAFMQKIQVVDAPEMTRLYPKYAATVVTATQDDGSTVARRVDNVPGFANHPMQRTDFEKKFRANTVSARGPRQADEALAAVRSLDQSTSISTIFDRLVVT